ncbi:glycosomal malate dehydrogenase, putative [Bodo saltans]|uniref:malate dehydrogenase n=1 Tax=Bodo saltans TaxID=75058 RepID=A0A0S4ITJ4_BODSA|nr:glycosomal malate dehydrogenase, putative [Bodo saltans]|eukprot:CUF75085.1 glycosomal malate dehydrogenase, putative [Bodo saltans]
MVNVCVIGAAGGIGQPLSLLLALGLPNKTTLSLYDVAGAAGVAADISHIDRDITIKWANGKLPTVPADPEMKKIAQGVDLFVGAWTCSLSSLVSPASLAMSRDDLFNVNAGIVLDVVKTCASVSPKACFAIVTNPVNSTVPIAANVLKSLGCYDKNKLFGVSTLDIVRATRFINDERTPLNVATVPVVGGHSDVTIVPLFSQLAVGKEIAPGRITELTKRVQDAGTEVVQAKAGKGSATLSMAAAGARFALWIVDGLLGLSNPLVYSYVDTDGSQDTKFLAIPVVLGRNGIQQRLGLGKITATEEELLKIAKKAVTTNISKGEAFAKSKL